jgi:hypothetical protein
VSGSKINNAALFDMTIPTVVGQYNKMKAVNDLYPTPSATVSNYHFRSDRYMENGSFFRLRNIRLDYNIDLKSKAIKNLNVYVSAQNLLTITDYSGYDPEVNTFNGNDRRQGVDLGAYPSAKTYNLGFGITF